jgi:ABC-2 type transport system permease protein
MVNNINNIEVISPESIVSPVTTKIEPIVQERSNLTYMYPSLVIMLIMFIGLLLPSLLIIMEKKSSAYFRIFVTPTGEMPFIIATFLTSLIILFLQVMIILIVSQFYFKLQLLDNIILILAVATLAMTFFILAGMLIGYLFNSEEMATIASVSISSLMLLTSGLIFPLESMPEYISAKIQYNPFILGTDLLKKTILFSEQFANIKNIMFLFACYSVVIFILVIIVQKMSKFRFLHTKPNKRQMKREYLVHLFKYKDGTAKDLNEFVQSIKELHKESLHKIQKEKAIEDWLTFVLNNKRLAKLISKAKHASKDEIIKILESEVQKKDTKE